MGCLHHSCPHSPHLIILSTAIFNIFSHQDAKIIRFLTVDTAHTHHTARGGSHLPVDPNCAPEHYYLLEFIIHLLLLMCHGGIPHFKVLATTQTNSVLPWDSWCTPHDTPKKLLEKFENETHAHSGGTGESKSVHSVIKFPHHIKSWKLSTQVCR